MQGNNLGVCRPFRMCVSIAWTRRAKGCAFHSEFCLASEFWVRIRCCGAHPKNAALPLRTPCRDYSPICQQAGAVRQEAGMMIAPRAPLPVRLSLIGASDAVPSHRADARRLSPAPPPSAARRRGEVVNMEIDAARGQEQVAGKLGHGRGVLPLLQRGEGLPEGILLEEGADGRRLRGVVDGI